MTTFISDMGLCMPRSALSTTPRAGHWRLIPYESDEVSGVMAFAGPITNVPDLTLPLDVKGWHAIHVGYATQVHGEHVAVKVRLSSDPCYQTIADDEDDGLSVMTIREVFWRYADLAGEEIRFRQHSTQSGIPGNDGPGRRSGGIAFVRLEALTEEQVERIRADRADLSKRRVIVSNDGGFVAERNVTTEEGIIEVVDRFRDSDVGRIDWSVVSGEITKYPSRIGDNLHERDCDVQFSPHAKIYVQNLRTLIDQGLIPHEVAIRHAHRIGLKFYYMFRMALGPSSSPLYDERPDLSLVDRDGTPLPKLSFAFPEVQQRVLDLMDEVIDDEMDGINICWIRGLRVIGYEQPVIDAFREAYGEDMRSVPGDDPRICEVQARFMTQFMKKVRALTDERGRRRGRPIPICAMVSGPIAAALRDACDIRTWVAEKLIDEMVGAAVMTRYLQENGLGEHIYCGPQGRDAYRAAAVLLAETGADGLFIWDAIAVQNLANHWSMIRRLGHTEEVIDGRDDKLDTRHIPLKTLGGIDVCHTQPWGGYDALVVYTGG